MVEEPLAFDDWPYCRGPLSRAGASTRPDEDGWERKRRRAADGPEQRLVGPEMDENAHSVLGYISTTPAYLLRVRRASSVRVLTAPASDHLTRDRQLTACFQDFATTYTIYNDNNRNHSVDTATETTVTNLSDRVL